MSGTARLVRCSADALYKLRNLNEAEIITLYTPFVPHPASTSLARDMDPFEPLGRALPRRVRHVPYRLDHGMTEMHTDFLSSSGAVIIVICVTNNVLQYNMRAFEQQIAFARGINNKTSGNSFLTGVPVVMLIVDDESSGRTYIDAVPDFPTLLVVNEYIAAALTNAVRVLFGH